MFKSPNAFKPTTNPENAAARRKTVLRLMRRHGYITEEEANNKLKIAEEQIISSVTAAIKSNIADGKATLDLHSDDFLAEPYLYVRFYITGDNGICYSQPIVLNVEGEEFEKAEIPETHDISTFLRGLVTVVDVAFFRANPFIWIFKYFGLGYNPVTFERLFNPF